MQFTHEHTAIHETTQKFVENEINPFVDEWEEDGIWPARKILKKLGDLGLIGTRYPTEYGGQGLDYSYHAAFLEGLGVVRSGGVGMGVSVQTDMSTPALARFGSEELKREFLAPAIAGDMVTSIAVSEPHAGSDVAQIKTAALKDGDDYVINGSKMWITNSTQADWLCLLANTEGDNPHQNKTLIIVPTDTKGISFSQRLNKLGMRSSDTAQIFFEDVRVPQRNRIGEEGRGFTMQMSQFQEERLSAALLNVKTLEVCIDETINYTRERKIFGRPILDNQVVHFRLAELQTEIELCRSLAWRAVDGITRGEDVTQLASMAKLKIGRLNREVADACMQYWGGMGYMWDNFVSRTFRDLRLTSIGGGADEVMLQIICKNMGILPSQKR